MIWDALLQKGRLFLTGEEAALDAWILFSEVFQVERGQFFLNKQKEAEPEKEALYLAMLERRKAGEPVAYIIGNWEFMGLPFKVDPHVLIPRPDTETLVEAVLDWAMPLKQQLDILDLCTGSGCIAISLASFLKNAKVDAVDISAEALGVAAENAKLNEVCVSFWQGDLWEAVPKGTKYDLIVSNPPYIDRQQLSKLDSNVIDFEPILALDGGEDGLNFYRRLSERATDFLKPGGRMYWEIGYDQGETASAEAEKHGLTVVEVRRDLAGHDRVVIIEKNGVKHV